MRLGKEEAAQQGSGVSRRQFAAMGVAVSTKVVNRAPMRASIRGG